MNTYRVAVVGSGRRSRQHIKAYEFISDAEVVACCAPTPTRREELAADFGIKAYADAAEMITAERPDMVHLVTWPDTRVELMTLVSDKRVPLCTVEKPIATGVVDWRALGKLSAQTETKFAVCHQLRWHTDLARCRQTIVDGTLGDVRFLDMSAGMNIAGQGTHILNYGRSLIGDPNVVRVFGSASGWDTGDVRHPAPATTQAYVTFDNGVRGIWTSGGVSPRAGDPATIWQHVRVAAYADRGRVNFEEFGTWEIVTPIRVERSTFGDLEIWQHANLNAQAAFHRAMFDWLTDDTRAPGTSLDQSLHEWKVVLALYTSALQRRPVDLEGFEPDDRLFHDLAAALHTD